MWYLTCNSATAFIDITSVTRAYLGIDKHFLDTERALYTKFRHYLPWYSTCPLLSNSTAVGVSVSGQLVAQFCVFGLPSFHIYNELFIIVDVVFSFLLPPSAAVCAPVANLLHEGTELYFRPARSCNLLCYIQASVQRNVVPFVSRGVGWNDRKCSRNVKWV